MTPGRRQRLEQKRVMLQANRDLLLKKIEQVRKSWIIEYNVSIKFQLEQQLQGDEATLIRLDSELDEIEQSLL